MKRIDSIDKKNKKIVLSDVKESKFSKKFDKVLIDNIPLKLIIKKNLEKYLLNQKVLKLYMVAMYSVTIFLMLGLFFPYTKKLFAVSVGLYFCYKEVVSDWHMHAKLRK